MLRFLARRLKLAAWQRYRDLEQAEPRLTYLFWEATLACNLACAHCGSDCLRAADTRHELTTDEALAAFRAAARAARDPSEVIVAITGGEPLLRRDLFVVAHAIRQTGMRVGLVTNGLRLDKEAVVRAAAAGIESVSVSIDGLEATHDALRGLPGSFARATRAVELLARAGFLKALQVSTSVSPAALSELPALERRVRELGATDWRLLTIFPNGRAGQHPDLQLRREQVRQLFGFIRERRQAAAPGLEVYYGDEGYLGPEWEGQVRPYLYSCDAGRRVAGIYADGAIGACPNLSRHFTEGNVRTHDLAEVWRTGFSRFRDRSWMRTGPCRDCDSFALCEGNSLHLWDPERNRTKLCHLRWLT
jgi:radical SAM protein with 4Fe4S-binding SPASM domain